MYWTRYGEILLMQTQSLHSGSLEFRQWAFETGHWAFPFRDGGWSRGRNGGYRHTGGGSSNGFKTQEEF